MPDETDHEFEFCPAATYKKLLLIDLQAETASDEFFGGNNKYSRKKHKLVAEQKRNKIH